MKHILLPVLIAGLFALQGCAGPDYAAQAESYRASASAGDVDGMYALGLSYYRGAGVEKDDGEALKWLRLAGDGGHAEAQNAMGSFFLEGDVTEQDDERAAKWFAMASAQGHPQAMTSLGLLYDLGAGVPEDHAAAAMWYERAAELGAERAMLNLGILMQEEHPEHSADLVEAFKWLDLARWATGTSSDKEVKWTIRGAFDALRLRLTDAQIEEGQSRAAVWGRRLRNGEFAPSALSREE